MASEAPYGPAKIQRIENSEESETEKCLTTGKFSSLESVYEHLGGTGRYNVAVLILMMLCKAYPGMITLSPNFTAAGMHFNCSSTEATAAYVARDENCTMDLSESQQCWLVYNCSSIASGKDQQIRLPCTEFSFYSDIFEQTSISRFFLVCDRAWMAHLSTTFYFLGSLFGCSLYGALADKFGRLRIIWICALNLSLCTVGAAFAPYLWLYWTLQLLAGFGNGGLLTCLYTYAVENTDTKHRSTWGFLVHNGWTIGMFFFTLMAYYERDYQKLLLYSGLSVSLPLVLLPLLSESPRWLVSTGRYEEADEVLQRISRINRSPLGRGFSSREIAAIEKLNKLGAEAPNVHFWHLFSHLGVLRVTLTIWSIFFGVTMAFFGLSLSVNSLGGDIFIDQLILAAVEPFARLFCLLLSCRLGRRPSIGLSFTSAAVSLAATGLLLLWPHMETWRVVAAMIGKFWITMAFDLAWLYAAEVFPTVLRSVGVGTSSAMSRAGGLLSTLVRGLSSVWAPLPFLVFAAGPVISMSLTFMCCLPETRDKPLPDSLDESHKFSNERRRKSACRA